jgi:hypothetical protein
MTTSTTTQEPQLGERTRTHVGGNVTEAQHELNVFKAEIERRTEEARRIKSLRQQILGEKISPLLVTYKDICEDHDILGRMQYLSKDPDVFGKSLLWEGRERFDCKGCRDELGRCSDCLRSRPCRIFVTSGGHKVWQKMINKSWTSVDPFTMPQVRMSKAAKATGATSVALVTQDTAGGTILRSKSNPKYHQGPLNPASVYVSRR